MIAPDNARCAKCAAKDRTANHASALPAWCWRVPVSRIEQGMGHEKFKCERCGTAYKIIPGNDGRPTVKEVSR